MAEIKRYKITVDADEEAVDTEKLGIRQIAFVKRPAVKIKGLAFSQEERFMSFKDEPKMRIAAPVMIPMSTYRKEQKSADGSVDPEFEAVFEREEIERIFQKFMSDPENLKNAFNYEHEGKVGVPAYIMEIWIVEDPKRDKSFTKFGIECPAGSVFAVVQVTDKNYYEKIVEEDAIGFSIEGEFGMVALKMSEEIQRQEETKEHLPKTIQKMKVRSKTQQLAFTKIESVNKWEQEVENTSFKVKDKITYKDESGNSLSVGANEWELEDGSRVLTDSEGVIQVVLQKDGEPKAEDSAEVEQAEETPEKEEVKTEELEQAADDPVDGAAVTDTTDGEPLTMDALVAFLEKWKGDVIKPMLDEAMKEVVNAMVKTEDNEEAENKKAEMAYKEEPVKPGTPNKYAGVIASLANDKKVK